MCPLHWVSQYEILTEVKEVHVPLGSQAPITFLQNDSGLTVNRSALLLEFVCS